MKRFLFTVFLIVLMNSLFAHPDFIETKDSLDNKNIIGANFSLLRTPRISFYLASPAPVSHEFFLSYRTEIFYYRKLKRNFFVGVQLGYSDISFRGNDIFRFNNQKYSKYEFTNKLIISNISLIKDFKILPQLSISPQIDFGIATKFQSSYKEENFISNSNSVMFHEVLLLSIQLTYHLTNNKSFYMGYGLRSYDSSYFTSYYIIKGNPNLHNFNFGFRHAF